MDEVEIVVAHSERATLKVGDVFLKVDSDRERLEREMHAMDLAPVPTARIRWHQAPVAALEELAGSPLGRLGDPTSRSSAAWRSTGAAIQKLHGAPLPPWIAPGPSEITTELDAECEWLVTSGVLSDELVVRNRDVAAVALREWSPAFTHGDLQIAHVFLDENDAVTGILDWSEAAQGDPLYDLATLTLGHPEHLDDLVAGYGSPVDRHVIRGWWSVRSLLAARWLIEHGFDPDAPGCEFDVLRAVE